MFIEIIFTVISFVGLIVFYWDEVFNITVLFKGNIYLWLYGIKIKKDKKEKTFIESKVTLIGSIQKLMNVTIGIGSKRSAYFFIGMSSIIGAFVFCILKNKVTPLLVYTAAFIVSVFPLLILVCRLHNLRIQNSCEGDILITELIDNYKMNYFNMYQAIEITAVTIKEAPNSKKLLLNLSKGLNTVSESKDIKKLLDDFRFSIGTSWGNVMADNMYFALSSGIRVSDAMEDLINTINKARKVKEFSKRENNEGRIMLRYMAPFCYLMTIIGGIKYFGLSAEEFIYYQFMTTTGITWFVIVLILYILGIMARMFLIRNKLDI